MARYILALDQGTTSSRAIVYDQHGRTVAMAQVPLTAQFPQDGWVEQNPEEIWSSQLSAARGALTNSGIRPDQISGIGISNQRETTIVWDRITGKAIYPAIVWQDRRTADFCAGLRGGDRERLIRSRTGLLPDSYFSATKVAWILDHVPGARAQAEEGRLAFGTVDSFIIWQLTHGHRHVTDPTNASRTLLFDIQRQAWDPDLLKLFDIPGSILPEVVPSSGLCSATNASIFGEPIPIAGIAGDQQAATFGQACFQPGMAKATYGTGCFLLMPTGNDQPASTHELLTTLAAKVDTTPTYALEGSVFVAGAAVQWLRDELGLIRSADEAETIAMSVPDSGGVHVVPAFTGLGAPYWDPHARGAILGLTRGVGRAHIVRATLEGIAFQCRDVLDAMSLDQGSPIRELRVDGGAANNNFLMQFQADILGIPVVRPTTTETTALGAAFLAGIGTGVWESPAEVAKLWHTDRIFRPQTSEAERTKLYDGWQSAVSRVR